MRPRKQGHEVVVNASPEFQIVGWQSLVLAASALLAGAVTGPLVLVSVLAGGLCVLLPCVWLALRWHIAAAVHDGDGVIATAGTRQVMAIPAMLMKLVLAALILAGVYRYLQWTDGGAVLTGFVTAALAHYPAAWWVTASRVQAGLAD